MISITNVNPNMGPVSGGTLITITGTNFPLAPTVTIGGNPATVGSVSSISITATTPLNTAGSVAVSVNSTSEPNLFRYVNPPTITNVSPSNGPWFGGTVITITGTNFFGTMNVTLTVTIGSQATTISSFTDTSIIATTPLLTSYGLLSVQVTAVGGIALNTFTYNGPIITNVSPPSGPTIGNTLITITGKNFYNGTPTQQLVQIGGNNVTSFNIINTTTITAITSSGTGTGLTLLVTFITGGFASSTFTYDNTLTITSLYPTGGPVSGGTPITITGTGFINLPTTILKIGGVVTNCYIDPTNTIITATTPPGTGIQLVEVTTILGGTTTSFFNYLPPLPSPPYSEQFCVEPPYNATNFTKENSTVYSTLVSYAKNSPNYPWNTGTDAQQIYRSGQNTTYFNTLNQKTDIVKTENNKRIVDGLPGNLPYPPFKSQTERLMYIQGLNLTASRNVIRENPQVPCSTIYSIIYPYN